jgi:hypothetical protein
MCPKSLTAEIPGGAKKMFLSVRKSERLSGFERNSYELCITQRSLCATQLSLCTKDLFCLEFHSNHMSTLLIALFFFKSAILFCNTR